ncbi:MAG: polysaccharide-degrading enzyme [Limisphaerales bacterium]
MIRGCVWLWLSCLVTSAADYVVGPGKPLSRVNEVPWERLAAGDRVRIHWRAGPYREKFVLCCRGTAERPIVVEGVPGPQGQLPVIDGRDATTREEVNFWGEERAVVKIGGANRPADTMPSHIILRGLEIRNGRRPYFFKGRNGRTAYKKNAASIYIEKGEHIQIDACRITDSGNGIITAPNTRGLLVSRCHLLGNGVEKSVLEHNAYISGTGVTFRFNRFGPLRSGCGGNNFKTRCQALNFYGNWVEGGNRCLDLVDCGSPAGGDVTSVWGNVLLKGDGGNNQVVHFGGDSGKHGNYRPTLLFNHNTVASRRRGNTVLVRRSTDQQNVICVNNVVFVDARVGLLCLQDRGVSGAGQFSRNWFSAGWRHSPGVSKQTALNKVNYVGTDPGFSDLFKGDFRLRPDSVLRGKSDGLGSKLIKFQYVPHQGGQPRRTARDLGAFEFQP